MMKQLFCVTVTICTMCLSAPASAQGHGPYNLNKAGLAIAGYDPVAYVLDGKAVSGKKEYSFMIDGATYYFVSAAHAALFRADPVKYQPQYGGWCAYAMGASGEKVDIDPETFKILDGKLYLFYNRFFNNTLKSWNKDEAHLKQQADANWQKLIIKK